MTNSYLQVRFDVGGVSGGSSNGSGKSSKNRSALVLFSMPKHTVGWPILCFYAFPGSVIPPWGFQGTSVAFGCTGGRADEVCTCFVRFLSWSCLSADHQKPLATARVSPLNFPACSLVPQCSPGAVGPRWEVFLVGGARFGFLRVGHVSAPYRCTNPTYHPLVHGF